MDLEPNGKVISCPPTIHPSIHPSIPHGGLVACLFQKLWPLLLQPAFIFLAKFFLHCSDQKKLEIVFLSV